MMAFLVDAYREEEAPNAKGGTDTRTVLGLDPRLAPVKVAVLPLSRNEKLSPLAREVSDRLRAQGWATDFDDAGAIGRRYRRQDEIGTPLCVTVDFKTVGDDGAPGDDAVKIPPRIGPDGEVLGDGLAGDGERRRQLAHRDGDFAALVFADQGNGFEGTHGARFNHSAPPPSGPFRAHYNPIPPLLRTHSERFSHPCPPAGQTMPCHGS